MSNDSEGLKTRLAWRIDRSSLVHENLLSFSRDQDDLFPRGAKTSVEGIDSNCFGNHAKRTFRLMKDKKGWRGSAKRCDHLNRGSKQSTGTRGVWSTTRSRLRWYLGGLNRDPGNRAPPFDRSINADDDDDDDDDDENEDEKRRRGRRRWCIKTHTHDWPRLHRWPLLVQRKGERKGTTYLNIKMNSTNREKNTATLSMVRSMTNSWRRRFGRKRTSFRIRKRRKVRNTLRPELPLRSSTNAWKISTTLDNERTR